MLLSSLEDLPRANPGLLARRALLNRMDRKYVTNPTSARLFLSELGEGYYVLLSAGRSWAHYETCYFDTRTLDLFHEHVRGRRPRYKIRVRRHMERRRAFLEIKRKAADDRTGKHRLGRDYSLDRLTEHELAFIATHTPVEPSDLAPSVWTHFQRATLLGFETDERITIDFDLRFERNGETCQQDDLVIIELKQGHLSNSTPAIRLLRELHLRERPLSKYCAGVALLHEAARPRYRQLLVKHLSRLPEWKTI